MLLVPLSASETTDLNGLVQWQEQFHLLLEFAPLVPGVRTGNRLGARVTLRAVGPDGVPGYEVTFRSVVFGSDLAEWLERMQWMSQSKSGKATLTDWERRELLQFSTSPERHPLVLVAADWDVLPGASTTLSDGEAYVDWHSFGDGPTMGVFTVFQALMARAEDLDSLCEGLMSVLKETRVELSRDW